MFDRKTLIKQRAIQTRRVLPVLEQEQKLMQLARANNWDFLVAGVAPIPKAPIFIGRKKDLLAVPFAQERGYIPPHALERMQAIKAAGIRVKEFVVVHEAPKELAPPRGTRIVSPREYWMKRIKEISAPILKGMGIAVAAVVIPVVVAVFGVAVLATAGLAVAALAVDPYLVAAVEIEGDEHGRALWCVVDSWVTE